MFKFCIQFLIFKDCFLIRSALSGELRCLLTTRYPTYYITVIIQVTTARLSKTMCGFKALQEKALAREREKIQYNLNCSNTDGSFTVDDSNSFFSPYKVLPTAQENKYLGIFFLFYHGIVCCVYSLESPHRGESNEYTTYNHCVENRKDFPKISLFAS